MANVDAMLYFGIPFTNVGISYGQSISLFRRASTSLPSDASRAAHAILSHWSVENRLHWCMDVAFGDDQMRVCTGYAAHDLTLPRHITMNLIRLDSLPSNGGIKVRRLIAATQDEYRAHLFGLG